MCTFTSMRVCPTVVGPLWALGCPVCCRCFFTCWSHLPFWCIGSTSLLCAGEPGGDCASGWGCLPRRSFSRWPSRSKRLSVASAPPALVVLEPEPEMLLSAQASPLVLGGPGPDRRSLLTPRPSAPVLGAPESLDWLLMSLRPTHAGFWGTGQPWAAGATGADRRRRIWLHSTALGGTSSAGWPRLFSSILRGWATPPCPPDPSFLRLLFRISRRAARWVLSPMPCLDMRLLELARGSGAADTCQDEWRAEFTAINFRSVLTGLGFLAMPFCKVAGVDVERDEVFALVGSAAGAACLLLLLFRTGSWL